MSDPKRQLGRACALLAFAGVVAVGCAAPSTSPAPPASSAPGAPTASAPTAPVQESPSAPSPLRLALEAEAPPPPGAPGAPRDVAVRAEGGAIVASWGAPSGSEPVVEYRAFSFDAGGDPVSQCNATAPATTCTLGELIPGAYTVIVRAVNEAGAGPISAESPSVTVP